MIKEQLEHIKNQIPDHVCLIAVSKTKSNQSILEAYNSGHLDFGENKSQELILKQTDLPKNIRWHMIGHLQRNKVKLIAPFVYLIHGVDSFRLLKEINKQAEKNNRTIDCLLQLHIANESTKFGFHKKEVFDILNSSEFKLLNNIKIRGLMGMATFTNNNEQIKEEFSMLQNLFSECANHPLLNTEFNILSMGMSGDYKLAIELGSNMIRIGSLIFGEREKH